MKIYRTVLFIVGFGSWFAFWYQVGWGDSWRWGLAFLAVNVLAFAMIQEDRKRVSGEN